MTQFARALVRTTVIIFVLIEGIGCAADRFAAFSESGDELIAPMSQASGLIANAYEEELKLERELVERVFAIREVVTRRSILIDLDEFVSPTDQVDFDLLDSGLRDSSTKNALVSEIRSGRMTIDEAKRLLGDHAQSARLSAELRLLIDGRITRRFAAIQEIERERENVLKALAARREAVSRLSGEMKQLAGALHPASDRAPSPFYPAGSVKLQELLTAATDLIDDQAVREALHRTIDDLYREEMK